MLVFNIIAPLVLVVFAGYLCARSEYLTRPQTDAISKFTFNIAIPAFLFQKMATSELGNSFSWQYIASFYLPVLVIFFIAYGYKRVQKLNNSNADSAVFSLGASYSNNVIVGLPVAIMAIGDHVIPYVFSIVTFHSAMLFTLTGLLASRSGDENLLGSLKSTLLNPLIFAITSGVLVNVSGLSLPDVLSESLALLGSPAIAIALFVLGSSLAYYKVKQAKRSIAFASVFKLLLLPLCVYASANFLFKLDSFSVMVLTLLSASPTGVNAYLIAKHHKVQQETVASTVVVTTILCAITLPITLMLLT